MLQIIILKEQFMKINGKNLSIYLLSLIFALFFSLMSCEINKAVSNTRLPSSYDTNISYNEAVRMGKPIAIDFYADWCPHCQAFAPILYDVRKQYEDKYTFVTVNGEKPENAQLMKEFNITGYPSLFLVNPKTNQKILVDQSLYSSPSALEGEFDKFYSANK